MAGALPGQTVRCRITSGAKNYLTGQLLEVVSSDFMPEKPLCPHDQCGGCPLAPLPYAIQLRWKEQLMRDALQRIGKIPGELIQSAFTATSSAGRLRHFRNKITLAFGRDEQGQFCLGFRRRYSHVVTAMTDCALVGPTASGLVARVFEAVHASVSDGRTKPDFWKFLTLRRGYNEDGVDGWRVILLTRLADRRSRKAVARIAERLLTDAAQLHAVIHQTRRKEDRLAHGDTTVSAIGRDDAPLIMSMPLGGRLFRLPVTSFFQVNNSGAEALAAATLRMSAHTDGPLLDLYCGVGSPGQLLSANHERCLGLELDAEAASWAMRNASCASLTDWHYESGEVGKSLRKIIQKKRKFGTVLMDPPRTGAEPGVAGAIEVLAPESIIYISCNAATLGRDAAQLSQRYQLKKIELVDMFPHTPHVEICTLWRARSTDSKTGGRQAPAPTFA